MAGAFILQIVLGIPVYLVIELGIYFNRSSEIQYEFKKIFTLKWIDPLDTAYRRTLPEIN